MSYNNFKYSSQLEPVTNALQVDGLIQVFQREKENPNPVFFSEIMKKCQKYENIFDIDFKIHRITQRQTMRSNILADSPETNSTIS